MEPISQLASGLLILLLLTSFVKIFTSLGILSYGFGLQGSGFQIVLFSVSIALSLLVADPLVQRAGGYGLLTNGGINPDLEKTFRPFLEKNAEDNLETRFAGLARRLETEHKESDSAPAPSDVDDSAANSRSGTPADSQGTTPFKEAFQLGLGLLIPLLLIDLIVANSLMALGMTQMSSSSLSLPLKLLLFFAVDGWTLVSDKLLGTYLWGEMDPLLHSILLQAFKSFFLIMVPILAALTLTGLIFGALQASFSIQDHTSAYAAKIVALVAVLYFLLPAFINAALRLAELAYR
jgi:type III secretory pathway component EscR/type III secretory pathway component EscS